MLSRKHSRGQGISAIHQGTSISANQECVFVLAGILHSYGAGSSRLPSEWWSSVCSRNDHRRRWRTQRLRPEEPWSRLHGECQKRKWLGRAGYKYQRPPCNSENGAISRLLCFHHIATTRKHTRSSEP